MLPFVNMSGDPEQEYFSDGITEDITTALSRSSMLFVISRNSSFTDKGAAVDARIVSRDLGVRYILEGSVRKAVNHIRVTAQLIDGTTGNHIWAEKYDGELQDIFELQDQITQQVAATIHPHIFLGMTQYALDKRELAIGEFKRAIEINPNCSLACGPLGTVLSTKDPDETISKIKAFYSYDDKEGLDQVYEALRKAGLSE
jgi:TolB-like protein